MMPLDVKNETTRVLVTGACGYIGSHTCVELLNKGYEVIALDNLSNSSKLALDRIKKITGKSVKFYRADILDSAALEKVFSKNNIDCVIHFAGLKAVGESNKLPLLYYGNNVSGTINLCKIMAKYNVKKMIFSSSATVYGDLGKPPYKEDMPLGKVSNPYGRTKAFIEKILFDLYNSDKTWEIIALRYFNPIGAHESGLIGEDPQGIPNNLMPYISQVAIGKLKQLTVFGDNYNTPDGTCIRDYIHVVDVARGHVAAIENFGKINGFEVYNLGTSKGTSVLELIKTFEDVNKVKINYKIGQPRPGDLPEVFADADKIYKDFGFKTQYDLSKMCLDTWNWQKNNPNGYN